ncbi:hypothetical protein H5V45_12020 [Nocardioides sp. KIGAM211]|uniref:HTH luxR-type domain-containing protein n=1 Tax=Nocardioides luti TaxID=2761101 RepID=A0A7X0RH42_9ACTN|nr:LuxR family transcriptional regulator [Nocardioides luti]MBB6628045.1 hypothetical protein [Nocardioides luti]
MRGPESEPSAAPGTRTRGPAHTAPLTVVRAHHPPTTHPALLRAWEQARAGEVNAALGDLDSLRVLAVLEPDSADTAMLLAVGLDCRLARGDVGEALVLGEELEVHLAADGLRGALAHHARGELATALHEPEPAAGHFATAGVLLADASGRLPDDLAPWRVGAALAALRLGRRSEATRLAREQLDLATTPYAVALALRTVATTGTGTEQLALLRRARDTLAGIRAGRLAAQVDTDLAGLLVLQGRATEALVLLRAAEAYAGRQDLWPLTARVRRLLERLGEQPRPVQSEALATLTVSERRVARLAALGRTNRQVAEELEVSVKAVEWHLSHVYRKLGIRSRSGLAGSLGVPD